MKASQAVDDKLKDAKFPDLLSQVEDKIAHLSNIVKNVEHNEVTKAQTTMKEVAVVKGDLVSTKDEFDQKTKAIESLL